MPAGLLPLVLLALLLVVAFQVIFSFNLDLYRAGEWGELARKALPLAILLVMVATLPLVQPSTVEWVPVAWALVLGVGIIGAIIACVVGRREEKARPSAYRSLHEAESTGTNAPLYGAEGGKSRYSDPYQDKE